LPGIIELYYVRKSTKHRGEVVSGGFRRVPVSKVSRPAGRPIAEPWNHYGN
jgi:hypothetical protein